MFGCPAPPRSPEAVDVRPFPSPLPAASCEDARLAALRQTRLLDSPPEVAFDRLTALVRRLLDVPTALVSLVEHDRQFFKSQQGLAEPWATRRETPLSHSLCQHVVAADAPLVVPDVREDPRVCDALAVRDLGVVAYLGVPVHSPDGHALGSLCAIDTQPRAWTADDRATLQDLAALVESEVALRAELGKRARIEATYRALFEASPDAVLVLDPETETVLDANDAACALYGHPRGDMAWASLRTQAHGTVPGDAVVARLAAKGGTSRFESVQYRADGTPFEVAIGSSLVRIGGRQLVLAVNRDVTERNRAEQALRVSEQRFRQIAEALPQLVWTTLPDGTHDFFNGRWYAYTGMTPGDHAWRWEDYVHPDDWARSTARLKQSLATGEPYEIEYRIRRASDGAYRWFIGRAEPVRDEAGRIVQWFGTSTDVHDLYEARERLRVSGERLRLVNRATNDVVWDLDVASGTITWSSAIADVLGWDEALLGTDLDWWAERLHPADRDRARTSFDEATRQASPVWQEEYRFRRADGTYAFVLDRGYLVRAADGEVIRVAGAMLDLTERKAFEADLVAACEVAESAARLKSSLLANMSHEIRTPLTAIIGFADVLAHEMPPELREYAEIIERSGKRLLETLNSVLDLAQIEGGEVALTFGPVDLLAEAEQVCDALRPLVLRKGLDLRVTGTAVTAQTDRSAFGRVLTNLVGNAVKFTERGSVTLHVGTEGGRAFVRVADTGAGISAAFLPHLFAEFKQESEGHERAYEGSGLGLAITRRLVGLLGGEIAVESEKGVGSVFTVHLPHPPAPVVAGF